MKRKALLCAILALILLFPAQPASALTSNQRETVISADTRLPIISVSVPSNADIMINPYRMPVQIGNEESEQPIVCSPAYIYSSSDVPLKVDVTVTGSVYPGSDMTLVSSPAGVQGTAKNVFLYFEMMQCSTGYWEEIHWDYSYDSSEDIVVMDGVPVTKREMVTLPPMRAEGDIQNDDFTWFRLAGDAARASTIEWNTNDGVSVTVTFTFTPVSYVEP